MCFKTTFEEFNEAQLAVKIHKLNQKKLASCHFWLHSSFYKVLVTCCQLSYKKFHGCKLQKKKSLHMVSLIDHENASSQGLRSNFSLHFCLSKYMLIWIRGKKSTNIKTDFLAYLVVDSMAFSPRGTQTTLNRLRQTFFKQFI